MIQAICAFLPPCYAGHKQKEISILKKINKATSKSHYLRKERCVLKDRMDGFEVGIVHMRSWDIYCNLHVHLGEFLLVSSKALDKLLHPSLSLTCARKHTHTHKIYINCS